MRGSPRTRLRRSYPPAIPACPFSAVQRKHRWRAKRNPLPSRAAGAARRRLACVGFLEFAAAGGLAAYGVSFHDMYRRAAYFVDKILEGTKPADLPVEQSTK